MKVEDVVQLLNNRLKEFKLSKDYAKMNGDLERMNAADEEIISLEDTLFKLNLLVDTSKSAAVKDAILAEVMTDGSIAVLDKYDITSYATDPLHEKKIMEILSKMGVMDTTEKIDKYIEGKALSSPVTGEMIMSAASAYDVDARLMMALMEQDSRFGTVGVAVRTLNPGNIGNDDSGHTHTYGSWQEGVTAVAEWLSRHRGSTIIPETPDTSAFTPTAASTSFEQIVPASASATTTTTTTTTNTTSPTASVSTPFEQIVPASSSSTTTTTASSSFSPTTSAAAPVTASSSVETTPVVTPATTTTSTK